MSGQPELWDAAPQMTPEQRAATVAHLPRVHARRTDPYTSDQALKAIAKDGTLMQLIWTCAQLHRVAMAPFNDTVLTAWIERATCKRQQRNVVARARGLLEDAGLFQQVGVRLCDGQPLMHYKISADYHRLIPGKQGEQQ